MLENANSNLSLLLCRHSNKFALIQTTHIFKISSYGKFRYDICMLNLGQKVQ